MDICRFAVGACCLQDLAQDAKVKSIVAPTPKSVDRNRACRRAYLQRFFEVWRAHTAQHATKSRRACNFPQHLLITSSAQFSGQHAVVSSCHHTTASQAHESPWYFSSQKWTELTLSKEVQHVFSDKTVGTMPRFRDAEYYTAHMLCHDSGAGGLGTQHC